MKLPFVIAILLISFGCSLAVAQPVISDISLRGLQIGKPQTLTLSGRNLTAGTTVLFPFQVTQKSVSGNGTNQLVTEVTIPDSTPAGIYPLRLFNDQGASDPVAVGIDHLPHRPFSTDKQMTPVALTGKVVGAQFARTKFLAEKGQTVTVECEANRLGSKLRPVVRVMDAKGKQVSFSQPNRSLGGDARCVFTAEDAGEYEVEIHDFLFRGANPGHFRLKIGTFNYADLSQPAAIGIDTDPVLKLIRIGTGSEFLAKVNNSANGWFYPQLENQSLYSGRTPVILASGIREFVERPDSKPQNAGPVPVGLNGRILKAREVDRFEITVNPNTKLQFDLWGRRLGSTIDARLTVKTAAGNMLGTNDDRPGQQDALVNVTVPDKVKSLIVEVSDVTARGSLSHLYRVQVALQSKPTVSPTVASGSIQIPRSGTVLIPVTVNRQNYAGEIKLVTVPADLPIQLEGARIAAGSNIGLLTISHNKELPLTFGLNAVYTAEGKTIVEPVLGPESDFFKGLDPHRKLLVAAPVASKQLAVAWNMPEADSAKPLLGSEIRSQIKLEKSPNLKGPIRIRLLTNQITPKKRIRQNNKDTFVDDTEKTLRAAALELTPMQSEGELRLTIPTELPVREYDLVVVAEVLSADKKQVLLSAASPTRTITPINGLQLTVKNQNKLTVPEQGTAKYQISGTVERNGISGPVTVFLQLPKSKEISHVVPADQTEFTANFEIPVNAEIRKLKKIKLEAKVVAPKEVSWILAQAKPISLSVDQTPATEKK